MQQTTSPVIDVPAVLKTLRRYWLRWLLPTLVLTALAVAYAVVRPETWEVSQALLVRDEAAGSTTRPGQFDSPTQMKTAEETVLELARSPGVVAAALAEVGPSPSMTQTAGWPTAKHIERAQRWIKVAAPNGAEFGKTEVFYIKVRHRDKYWAVAFTRALCNKLDSQLRQLRDRKAQSMVEELTKTVALAEADLQRATQKLAEQERQVGCDLAELRILNESASGESNLRQTLIAVEAELRQARIDRRANEQLLEMLLAAQKDPSRLIATPNRLLESQPALRQLKDGLVAAQLRTAQLQGELSPLHPKVKAAVAAQDEIRRHLRSELQSAVVGLRAELKLDASRINDLQAQASQIQQRMERLAAVRARYNNLVAEVQHRSQILNSAEENLADARASQAAAHAASLITLVDGPHTGDQPVGISRSMIVLWGLLGGLLAGWGLVLLTVPVETPAAAAAAVALSEGTDRRRSLSLKQALAWIGQSAASCS